MATEQIRQDWDSWRDYENDVAPDNLIEETLALVMLDYMELVGGMSKDEVLEKLKLWQVQSRNGHYVEIPLRLFRELVVKAGYAYDESHPDGREITPGSPLKFDILIPSNLDWVATIPAQNGLVCIWAADHAISAMRARG